MGCKILEKRVGTVLQGIVGPDGQPAKVLCSKKISGDFSVGPTVEVTFDFYHNEHGALAVHLTRRCRHRTQTGQWEVSAIDNRDAKGLKGFIEFAETLGLKGANLANIISGLKPGR
jgi:hypothetical protein